MMTECNSFFSLDLSAFTKTQVEIKPSRDQCFAGDNLELRCSVSGGDGNHGTISWMKLGGRLGSNVREYGEILRCARPFSQFAREELNDYLLNLDLTN